MSYKFEKPFLHMQLVFSLSFVKLLWPFVRITSYAHDQDHVHVHSHAILLHLEDSKYIPHPSTNKTPRCAMFISLQSYHHNVWAIQKEIKDAYPKKVCHMPTRHVKKKREKMHTQRRYATHPQGVSKKKEREKGKYSPYQKHYKGKRIHIKEFSSIIHQKYPHTCTSWSRLMTCFSFGSGLWLSKIWEARLPSYPPYLQIHQKEAIRSRVEKERRIKKCLGKEWITFERSERSPEELTNFFPKTL